MPNEYTVVGENRDDESELLVLGTDGQYCEYDPAREHFRRTEPNEEWELFAPPDELEVQSP